MRQEPVPDLRSLRHADCRNRPQQFDIRHLDRVAVDRPGYRGTGNLQPLARADQFAAHSYGDSLIRRAGGYMTSPSRAAMRQMAPVAMTTVRSHAPGHA